MNRLNLSCWYICIVVLNHVDRAAGADAMSR